MTGTRTGGSGRRVPPEERDGALAGCVALVTGGSSGIGEAIVRLFGAEGAKVAFCARTPSRGRAVEAAMRAGGCDVRFFQCDVSRENDVVELVQKAVAAYGGLDIVVNNAAIGGSGPIPDYPLSQWRRLFDTNVAGAFLVCKWALPHLRASDAASIINLGSSYSFVGVSGDAAYAATKAAIVSLTKSLALELAEYGVRVNALCPGATETPLMAKWLSSMVDPEAARLALTQRYPLGRLSTPEDQARAALFLASRESSFVTGHALLVDGGYCVP